MFLYVDVINTVTGSDLVGNCIYLRNIYLKMNIRLTHFLDCRPIFKVSKTRFEKVATVAIIVWPPLCFEIVGRYLTLVKLLFKIRITPETCL